MMFGPLLLIFLIVFGAFLIGLFVKKENNVRIGKFLDAKILLAGYCVLLVCSIIIYTFLPESLKDTRYEAADYTDEDDYNQFMRGLMEGSVDQVPIAVLQKEWNFPNKEKSFDVKTMGWQDGDPFIIVDDRGESGAISVKHIVSRSVLQNLDITSEVPSPKIAFKEGVLTVKSQPEKKIIINQFTGSFVTNQFKGVTAFWPQSFDSSINTDAIYITVPKGTLVSGPVEWIRDHE
ncbi:hypothetical protein R3398_06030 [Rossellomorea marisflavi]|uniref:hypothetical protein n=1 Tax=Rossellomorea marisflavi TaxID=189381 RepID=UPI00296F98E9|nr:hypothetical protein [Rossellomorea marisflavi]MDW4525937.1 hypothetical protein [Rossellomorea marisflavi]